MTPIMPAAWCSRMWQWNIQSPGLSAAKAISTRSRGAISTVSCHSRCAVGAPLREITQKERSEEHTSELQSLMRISYAVFCLKKKNNKTNHRKKTLDQNATLNQVKTI